MRVTNTNGWMYVVELEEPSASRPGRYFVGNKVRGYVVQDLQTALQTMSIPEVLRADVQIPDEVREVIDLTVENEDAAIEGRRAKTQQHEHISKRHTERHPVWPRIAKAIRGLLGREEEPDENTASIDEIYSRYI